jgi:hypothetical protein
VLDVSSIEVFGNDPQLNFKTEAARTYRVDFSNVSSQGPWSPLTDSLISDGDLQPVLDEGGATRTTGFYRVVLVR